MKTTIRKLVGLEMEYHGDSWSALVAHHPADLDSPIDTMALPRFTVWTRSRVYFPVVSGWAGSASRHPDGNPTEAQG